MQKIALGKENERMRFERYLRRFGEMKINLKFLSELLKDECRCDCSVPLVLPKNLLFLFEEVRF
jgi:hypothetical protein